MRRSCHTRCKANIRSELLLAFDSGCFAGLQLRAFCLSWDHGFVLVMLSLESIHDHDDVHSALSGVTKILAKAANLQPVTLEGLMPILSAASP